MTGVSAETGRRPTDDEVLEAIRRGFVELEKQYPGIRVVINDINITFEERSHDA